MGDGNQKAGGRVVSVNVGSVREILYHGRPRTTGIYKEPVPGRVPLRAEGVAGDQQADLTVHGGTRKAVYAYAAEDAAWWEEQLGREVSPGTFGENVTLSGLDVNGAVIGERWQMGTSLVEVTQPRFPCWKLGFRMGSARFPRRFLDAERPGTYLRVLEAGEVEAGDPVTWVSEPGHQLTVGLVAYLNRTDRPLAIALLDAVEAGIPPTDLQDVLLSSGLAARRA